MIENKCRVIGALLVAIYFVIGLPHPAAALQEPRSIATDFRLRTVRYSANEVFKFTGHYGYESSIEFSPEETIQTVSIGDSIAWMVDPSKDRLFIKPIEQDAMTNMTVITDKRTYHFELHAKETEDIQDQSMIFVMRFVYPEDDNIGMNSQADPIPDFQGEPDKFNFNYMIQGSDMIAPIRIFDDGEFTYFEFKDKNADVPAFFFVDAASNEELINFRAIGNFIVVERVAPIFTLRRGAYIVCVHNQNMVHEKPASSEPTFWERVTSWEIF